MFTKIFNYLAFGAIFLAIIGLYTIKDRVSTLSYQLGAETAQVNAERDSIHVLKAEFAYLCSPSRLRALTRNYLDLQSIKTGQMIKDPLIAEDKPKGDAELVNTGFTRRANHVKWRYKKATSKYLQTVSRR